MKKKTVITTESFEVWIIPPSDVPAGVAQGPEADSWKPDSTNQLLTPVPEEHPDKGVPPTHED